MVHRQSEMTKKLFFFPGSSEVTIRKGYFGHLVQGRVMLLMDYTWNFGYNRMDHSRNLVFRQFACYLCLCLLTFLGKYFVDI